MLKESIDADLRAPIAAADKDATARFRVLDRIANEVAQDTIEQYGVAHHRCASPDDGEVNPLISRGVLVLVRNAFQQRHQRPVHELHALCVLVTAAHQQGGRVAPSAGLWPVHLFQGELSPMRATQVPSHS
jgi:hypothetical protein